MAKYSDLKLLDEMTDTARTLSSNLSYATNHLDQAIGNELVGAPQYINFEDDDCAVEFVDDCVHEAVGELKDAREYLECVDANLAKLLALRLQLADLTGISFNVAGGREWVRLDKYEM